MRIDQLQDRARHPANSHGPPTAVLILTLWILLTMTTRGVEALEETYARYGHLIVQPFASAPFPHPARAQGHQYKDKVFPAREHYADSTVAIFVPKGFRKTKQIDVVVHFHGWYNTVADTLKQYQLIEQLIESGKHAVLVVPEGPHNAPDSFGGKLEDPEGFKRFMDEVLTTLKQRGGFEEENLAIGTIILSGHSGGYRVISSILDRGGLSPKVKEVWLFDALYAETEKFLAWWDEGHGRLLNIDTDGGGTKADSESMMQLLAQRGTKFLANEDIEVTTQELQANKLIFLHTDLGHNDVLEKRRTFLLFLKTSCLQLEGN